MATLSLTGGTNQFTWTISGLGSAFNSSNYLSAGVAWSAVSSGDTSVPDKVAGAEVAATSSGVKFSVSKTVSYTVSSQVTYTFYGYARAQNGLYYPCGSARVTISPSSSVTYQYEINFSKNDGSSTWETRYTSKSTNSSISYTFPDSFWTRTGYTFQCWTRNSDGTGTAYYKGGSVNLTGNLIVYAYWKKNTTYTGTITLSDTTYISGTAGNITVNVSNLSAGSGRWSIVVNGVTKVSNVSGGNYTFLLDYLYDGQTSSKYTIYLVDPDGTEVNSFNIYHKTKPVITYTVKVGGVTGGHALSTTITVNGTSFYTNSKTVNLGDTVSIAVTFEEGYEFEGWYTTASGTTKVTGNHPYYIDSISSNVTLYAKGQLKQYTYYYRIYLYLNGSQYGDPVAGSLQTTSSNGYGLSLASALGLISDLIENNWTFDSSTTSNISNNPSYSNGYFIITGGSTSRTVCKLYYTLTYTLQARIGTNLSVGIQSVSVNPSSVKPNGEATWTCALKGNYIFQGWYKNAACTLKEVEGANYQTYLKENINDDIILYAAAYTSSYPFYAEPYSGHDNYFSSITVNNYSSIEANVGDSITWKCVLASPNYTFDGWYTSSGTRISTNLEYSTIVTDSQAFFTLYAKANVYNYTITYRDLEHGLLRYQDTPSSAESSFYYRLWSCPSDWKLLMAEYNFDGWKEESTSNEYEENEQILLNSNNRSRTFNAIWSKKEELQTFTITYIYNNTEEGAPTPSPVRVKDTTSAITPGLNSVLYRLLSINDSRFSTWTNEKFTFEGWRNLTTGLINEENEVITVSQNTNFETVWSTNTKTTYTLKYNKGNISENISVPSLQTTSSYSSSLQFEINPNSNDPTIVGLYKFKGWGTDLNNSSTRYYKGDYITLYKNTNPIQTLYAQWEEISTSVTYKITYHSNNISSVSNMPSPNPQVAENITADSYTFTIPNVTPTCNWQKFKGWGLTSSSTTPAYSPNQNVTLLRNSPELELYAIWSQSLYFTWTTSEANDAVQIQKGKPFCITSQKWNDFNKLIKDYLKPSYNRTLVLQGWQFSYIYMRETLTALQGLANDPFPGFTDSSDPIDRNKPIKASYFTELKTYLNNKLKNP